jgi:SAM-dependent methyltransferase
MRAVIPWWAKIAAKLLLSRVPLGHRAWRRLGAFRHGAMLDPGYALQVFRDHFARCVRGAREGFVALELGPGDSLASAVIAAAHGATRTYLIDVGSFASADADDYRRVADYLRKQGLQPPDLEGVKSLESLLRACRATYATGGLQSLRELRTGSVDFIWSQAVLEHVRRAQFRDVVGEMRRIIRTGGVCSHQIDLQDHLGGALNNMRLPTRWWEADWMARSGFYTNRMRMQEMLSAFEAAGFAVADLSTLSWERLPTPRHALAREFRSLPPEELLVRSFTVTLRPV